MNASLPLLFERMRHSLRTEVLPELASAQARSQLAGVIDILAKLEAMTAWSPDVLAEQRVLLERGLAAFGAEAAAFGFRPDTATEVSAASTAALQSAVRAGEAEMVRCTDWLFDAHGLPAAAAAGLDQRLRELGRDLLLTERKHIPRADFGAMTSGAARP